MKFTQKDTVATALIAAVMTIYLAYLAFDGIPFVRDPEGMAGVGLILGFASRRIGGRAAFAHQRVAFAAGLGSMAHRKVGRLVRFDIAEIDAWMDTLRRGPDPWSAA